jgi:hypothetical protein
MKKLIRVFLVLFVVGVGYFLFLYFKPVPGTSGQKPVHRISASDLFTSYENDPVQAKADYEGKVIEVEGEILEITESEGKITGILLSGGSELTAVNCSMEAGDDSADKQLQAGQIIKVKGVCQGMMDSDLFADVILNRCVIE